jgi:uncharacterized protein (TIGR03067 family)
MTRALLAVLVVGLLVAADDKADDVKKDLKAFEGTWTVAELQVNGKKATEEEVKNFETKLTFKDNKLTLTLEGQTFEGTVTIDPSKTPKTVDVKAKNRRGDQVESHGIYEIDKDTLKVCYVTGSKERPKEFKSTEGSGAFYTVYKRAKKQGN